MVLLLLFTLLFLLTLFRDLGVAAALTRLESGLGADQYRPVGGIDLPHHGSHPFAIGGINLQLKLSGVGEELGILDGGVKRPAPFLDPRPIGARR